MHLSNPIKNPYVIWKLVIDINLSMPATARISRSRKKRLVNTFDSSRRDNVSKLLKNMYFFERKKRGLRPLKDQNHVYFSWKLISWVNTVGVSILMLGRTFSSSKLVFHSLVKGGTPSLKKESWCEGKINAAGFWWNGRMTLEKSLENVEELSGW